MNYSTLLQQLQQQADETYAGFLFPLLPGLSRPILGVRLPKMRSLAHEAAQGDWRTLLTQLTLNSYEEQVFQGLLIGAIDIPWKERRSLLTHYVTLIDNWGACDAFVSSIKFIKENKENFWPLISSYAQSKAPYDQRFAAVTMLWYYINPNDIERTVHTLCAMQPLKYYARMGVAWALTECFLTDPEHFYPIIEQEIQQLEVLKMMRRKISQSLRTPENWRKRMK